MKKLFSCILVLLLAVSLIGCTGTNVASETTSETTAEQAEPTAEATEETTSEPIELTMWTFLNPNGGTSARELALAQIIDNFEAANPNITIVTESIDYSLIPSQYLAAHVAGTAPDIIWMSFLEMGEVIRAGAMADLNTLLIDNWTDEQKAELDDAFFQFGATDTERYQLTFVRSADALIYRTDLFEAAGYTPPFKSWDEFIEACQAVTQDTDGDGEIDVWGFGQQFGSEKPISNVFISSMVDLQGGLFTEDGTPDWNNENGVKSMQLATDMVTNYQITPSASASYSQEDLIEGFCAGKYAVITAAASRYSTCVNNATFDSSCIRLCHFPSWEGDDFGKDILSGWCVGIWSGSEKQEAAAKFIDYLFSVDSEKIWMEVGGQPAMRASTAAEMADLLNQPGNEYLTTMTESFSKYGYARPWQYTISGYDKLQNEAAQRILLDGMDISESLGISVDEFIKQNG